MYWKARLRGFWAAYRDGEFQESDTLKVCEAVGLAIRHYNSGSKALKVPASIEARIRASQTMKELELAVLDLYDWADSEVVFVL